MVPEPKIASMTPQLTKLDATPAMVARGLRHLPGLVFFDSSSTASGNNSPISIVAARPVEKIVGDIFEKADRENLQQVLSYNSVPESFPDEISCAVKFRVTLPLISRTIV